MESGDILLFSLPRQRHLSSTLNSPRSTLKGSDQFEQVFQHKIFCARGLYPRRAASGSAVCEAEHEREPVSPFALGCARGGSGGETPAALLRPGEHGADARRRGALRRGAGKRFDDERLGRNFELRLHGVGRQGPPLHLPGHHLRVLPRDRGAEPDPLPRGAAAAGFFDPREGLLRRERQRRAREPERADGNAPLGRRDRGDRQIEPGARRDHRRGVH